MPLPGRGRREGQARGVAVPACPPTCLSLTEGIPRRAGRDCVRAPSTPFAGTASPGPATCRSMETRFGGRGGRGVWLVRLSLPRPQPLPPVPGVPGALEGLPGRWPETCAPLHHGSAREGQTDPSRGSSERRSPAVQHASELISPNAAGPCPPPSITRPGRAGPRAPPALINPAPLGPRVAARITSPAGDPLPAGRGGWRGRPVICPRSADRRAARVSEQMAPG